VRVALVCPYDITVPGGVQGHVRQLADALRALGDEVLVVAPADGQTTGSVARAGGSVGVPWNDSVAPVALSPLAGSRALEAVREHSPDVVHIHEPAVPVVSLAAAARAPRPIVATFHAWSEGDAAYRAAAPVLRRTLRRVDARIAVSVPAAAFHARMLGTDEGSFEIIPNGVEVGRFATAAPHPSLRDADAPVLLFVGRLERRKGLVEALRAYVTVRRQHRDVRLVVVGEGPEGERVRDLVPGELRDGIRMVGRVEGGELPRYHAAADIFLAPSLGGESFGIVLVEAMAAGIPVVASSIPGYASVVQDDVTGRLVPPGDADALARTIAGLLDDRAARSRLADAARREAERYDWATVATRIRDVYTRCTDTTRA
jgi:phosphatidyl-myo-inositol alpha-mannosyltransferase